MDLLFATTLLFVSLCHWVMTDLVLGLLSRLSFATSIHLVFCPTILSGAAALLVKYLAVTRFLPMYKLASGGLLALLASWYIDRICRNHSFLLVRAVGCAILFCAAVGIVIVSEGKLPENRPPAVAESAPVLVAEDYTPLARD